MPKTSEVCAGKACLFNKPFPASCGPGPPVLFLERYGIIDGAGRLDIDHSGVCPLTKQEYITHNIDELFKSWLVQATAWGVVIFPFLSILDYVATPENFRTFLFYRIAIALTLLTISLLSMKYKDRGIAFHQVLAYIAVISSAVTIEFMILRFGGDASPYYVGMILLCVVVVGFMPGSFYFYVIAAFLIYAVYLVPILAGGPISDFRKFFMANAFLSAIFSSLLLVKYLSGRRLITEFGATYDLEHHQQRLETLIEERTSALSEAVVRLRNEIEERQRVDAELLAVNEQLRQSQKMEAIGLLAGGIAHDFNNLLTTIKGCVYILQKKIGEDDPLGKYVEQAMSSLKRGSDLTMSLLAFSRRQVITPKSLDMNEVIRRASDLLSRLMGEDIELVLSLEERKLTVLADEGQLEQVLMNLAANARDAMSGGGRVTIATGMAEIGNEFILRRGYGSPGVYVLVSVSDTGAGMDAAQKERIFEPFFTTKEFGAGSGLGLAIVYGIIKQHNGYIEVDTEQGKGATFRIYLPLSNAEAAESSIAARPLSAEGTETILVAEDNDDVRKVTVDVLRESGYRVIEAADGEEAVRVFGINREKIHLVLLDVIMPRKKGRQVYEEIRKMSPGCPVLFTSGYVDDTQMRNELGEEGMHFISKSAETAELLGKIRELLDR